MFLNLNKWHWHFIRAQCPHTSQILWCHEPTSLKPTIVSDWCFFHHRRGYIEGKPQWLWYIFSKWGNGRRNHKHVVQVAYPHLFLIKFGIETNCLIFPLPLWSWKSCRQHSAWKASPRLSAWTRVCTNKRVSFFFLIEVDGSLSYCKKPNQLNKQKPQPLLWVIYSLKVKLCDKQKESRNFT